MAGDKSINISYDEFVALIKVQQEMPFNITEAQIERLLCLAFETNDIQDLKTRNFNELYDYPAKVLPALKACDYQP